ncbi:MAG: extracellular solute-binding protein [Spirochaetota bacterium]
MPSIQKIVRALKSYFGVIVIVLAFIASAFVVLMNNRDDSIAYYVAEKNDTVASIAEAHQTTVNEICDANYPDISPKDRIAPGTRIKLPKSARTKIVTVTFGHWQLEPGVRDGVAYFAQEYKKLYPNVRIVQNAVPESTYGQWFITQMLGGTAPDLIECALGVPYPLLVSYYLRYFTPMTDYILRPNPYNRNNEFNGIPLRETTKDGLKNCYIPEIQEYMTIALTHILIRFYYNKDLLKKLTGRTEAPATFTEFLAACEEIKKHKFISRPVRAEMDAVTKRIASLDKDIASRTDAGEKARFEKQRDELRRTLASLSASSPEYAPIASSKYHISMVENNLFNVVTSKARDIIDFNHDCTVSVVEQYIGMKTGLIDLNYPPYRAKFKMVAQYASNCMPGFTGLNRDDGVLMFVQQRSVFIPTGTWDAGMMEAQAKDNGFTVGVMDFPYPSTDDPDLYRHYLGPTYEDPPTAFNFGCPTPESAPERKRVAIDFLLFLASKENNAKFNQMVGWIPVVAGVEGEGVLKQFKPHLQGVTPGINLSIGGEAVILWQQLYAMYQVGQMSFEEMRDKFTAPYLERGYRDYLNATKDWRRATINDEKTITMLRLKSFTATNADKLTEYTAKYRYLLLRPLTRAISVSEDRIMLKNTVEGKMKPPKAFDYSSVARARLRI